MSARGIALLGGMAAAAVVGGLVWTAAPGGLLSPTMAASPAGDGMSAAVTAPAPQRRRGFGGFGRYGPPMSSKDLPISNIPYVGKFTFLRLRFDTAFTSRGNYEWGIDQGWNHDYPRAEEHLSLMLDELTTIDVTIDNRGGNIFSFTDPELYNYPFVYISEPAYWDPSEEELEGLGEYLLKGGFVMVDDMESDDTQAFHTIIQRAIPGSEFVILDTTHPIFNCFFQVTQSDIFNQNYRSRYGDPVIFGVYEDNDPSKRLLAVVNHNQDIGESWEWSNTGYVPPEQANNSYKIGMNYIICSMLH